MDITFPLWIILVSFAQSSVSSTSLQGRLSAYSVTVIDESRISKRSLGPDTYETIKVNALGKDFVVQLESSPHILHPYFRSTLLREDADNELDHIESNEIFHGSVTGCASSWVRLIRTEFGFLGSFNCDGETYHLEPARLHLPVSTNGSTIVYRTSDVVSSPSVPIDLPFWAPQETTLFGHPKISPRRSHRKRRTTPKPVELNRCYLKIVADHLFFKRVGNESLAFTTRYIVNLMERVNQIFTSTDFGDDDEGNRLINLGFNIQEIVIHEKPHQDHTHYNSIHNWEPDRYLESFNNREASVQYCLVLLLTARSFSSGALGLAYVGANETTAGICPSQNFHGQKLYNTLYSSVAATVGDSLLVTREADIVTAHELGHSWGASHDNDEACRPSHNKGGYFIMNPFAVSGYDQNNNKFSNCSKSAIRRLLSRRSDTCFKAQQTALCGNGVLEDGEECDEGFILPGTTGSCCTRHCRLTAGAQCSHRNQPCCSETCVFLPSDKICKHANLLQCSMQSTCTGYSGDCPLPDKTPDGSLCVDGGECQDGVCLPFCERTSIKKKACICSDPVNACRRCCRPINSTVCRPEPNADDLRDGTFCIQGTCKQSVCVREVVDVVGHLWGVLEGVDGTNWVQFFKSNIAGIIIILSLVIWCPVGFLVSNWDRSLGAKQKTNVNIVDEKIAIPRRWS